MLFKKLKAFLAILTMMTVTSAYSDITDGKFGINQIFDVQYNWSGTTLNASNFISPYKSNFQHLSGCTSSSCTIPAGSYFQFFPSTTNPGSYGLALYNQDGTVNTILHNYGTITALGSGAIFYVGSGFFGNVITPSAGYNYGDSAQFTNMVTTVTSTEITSYTWASTTPLSAGQTAGSGSSTPTVVSTAPGSDIVTRTTTTGTTTTTSNSTRGTTTTSSTTLDTRTRNTKTLDINRNVVTTNTTPITTVVTNTTPVTTVTNTTPTTVTTYSDNTTTTTNGTTVTTTTVTNQITTSSSVTNEVLVSSTNTQYSTRIDQFDKLNEINNRVNQLIISDPLSRNKIDKSGRIVNRSYDDREINVFVHGTKTNSNLVDTYKSDVQTDTIGAEIRLDRTSLVGLQYNRNIANLKGTDAGGSLVKDTITFFGLKVYNNWLVKYDIGRSSNTYNTTHSLPALNARNYGIAKGSDTFVGLRLYTPSQYGLRPFVGLRNDRVNRDAVIETGTSLTAVDYPKLNQRYNSSEFGLRYDYQIANRWALASELAQNERNLTTYNAALMYNAVNNSTLLLKLTQQRQQGIVNDSVQLQLALRF